MFGITLALVGIVGCRSPETPERIGDDVEGTVALPPTPEELVTDAEKAAAVEPPAVKSAPASLQDRSPLSIADILKQPSRLIGRTFLYPDSPIRGGRSPMVHVDHRFMSYWANDEAFIAWIGEPIVEVNSRTGSSAHHRVLDALAFPAPQPPEYLVMWADLGYGCLLETDGNSTGDVVARAQYRPGSWDKNSCEQELAESVLEAWWANTTDGQFVPVEDLSRVQCYRGACP